MPSTRSLLMEFTVKEEEFSKRSEKSDVVTSSRKSTTKKWGSTHSSFLILPSDLEKKVNGRQSCRLAVADAKKLALSLNQAHGNRSTGRARMPQNGPRCAGIHCHCRSTSFLCSWIGQPLSSLLLYCSKHSYLSESPCLPKLELEFKSLWPRRRVPLKLSRRLVWVRPVEIASFQGRIRAAMSGSCAPFVRSTTVMLLSITMSSHSRVALQFFVWCSFRPRRPHEAGQGGRPRVD